jgi:hypothetical protein
MAPTGRSPSPIRLSSTYPRSPTVRENHFSVGIYSLNVRHRDKVDRSADEAGTGLPRLDHRVKDRVPVDSGQSFDAADAGAFQKHPQTQNNPVSRQ